jgi:hypothetical protein
MDGAVSHARKVSTGDIILWNDLILCLVWRASKYIAGNPNGIQIRIFHTADESATIYPLAGLNSKVQVALCLLDSEF